MLLKFVEYFFFFKMMKGKVKCFSGILSSWN